MRLFSRNGVSTSEHGRDYTVPEDPAELLLDLKVNGIFCSPQVAAVDAATVICEVQETADCLGADCVPRYVEMKKLLELEIDDEFQFQMKQKVRQFQITRPDLIVVRSTEKWSSCGFSPKMHGEPC